MDTKSIKNLFDKYVLIWIWSIFVSINTALSYNIFNLYDSAKWQKLNIFLIPLYIFAMLLAVASWLALFNFFRLKILSLILTEKPNKNENESMNKFDKAFELNQVDEEKEFHFKKIQWENDLYASKQLRSAFFYIIFAIFIRFLIPIVEMFFGVIYNK